MMQISLYLSNYLLQFRACFMQQLFDEITQIMKQYYIYQTSTVYIQNYTTFSIYKSIFMIQKLQQSIEAFTYKLSQNKFSFKLRQHSSLPKQKTSSLSKNTLNKFQHTLKFFANTALQQSIAQYLHQTLIIQSTLCLQEFKSITKEISLKEHRHILETLQKFLLNFELDEHENKLQVCIMNRKCFSLQNIISTMPKVKKIVVQCLIFLLFVKKSIAEKNYKHVYKSFFQQHIFQKLQTISPSEIEFCTFLKAKIYSCVAIIALHYKQKQHLETLLSLGIQQRRKSQTLFRKYDESYVSVTFYLLLKYIKHKIEDKNSNTYELQIILNRQLKFCENMEVANKHKKLFVSQLMEAKSMLEKNKKIIAYQENNENQVIQPRRVFSQNNYAYNIKTKSLTRKNQQKYQVKPSKNIQFNEDLAYRVEIFLQLQNLKTVEPAPCDKKVKPNGKVYKKKKAPNVYRNFKLNKQILQISFEKLSKQLRKFGNIHVPRKEKIRKQFQQYITNFQINFVEKESKEILLDENSYNTISFVKIWGEKSYTVQLQLITDQPQFHLLYRQQNQVYNIALERSSHVLCERFKTFWPTIKYLFRKKISQIQQLNEFQEYTFSKKHRKIQEKNSSLILEKIFKDMDYEEREDISTFCNDVFKFVNLLLAPKRNYLQINFIRRREQDIKREPINENSGINNIRSAVNLQRIQKIIFSHFTIQKQYEFYQIDAGITMTQLQPILQNTSFSFFLFQVKWSSNEASQKQQFNLPIQKLQALMINTSFLRKNFIDLIESSQLKRYFRIRMIRALSSLLEIRKNVGPTVCISNLLNQQKIIQQTQEYQSQPNGFDTYPISIHQNYSNIMRRLQNSIELKRQSKWKILKKKIQYCIPFLTMKSRTSIRKTGLFLKQKIGHQTQTSQKIESVPRFNFSKVKQVLCKKQTKKQYSKKFKLKSHKFEAKITISIPRTFSSYGWTIDYDICQQNHSASSKISFAKQDLQFLQLNETDFNLVEFSNDLLHYLCFFRQKLFYTLYFKIDNLMLKPLNKQLMILKENNFNLHKLQQYQPNQITIISIPCRIMNKFCMVILTVILMKNMWHWELKIQRLFEGCCMVCKLNYEEISLFLEGNSCETLLTDQAIIRQVLSSKLIRQKFKGLFKMYILGLKFQWVNKFQLRTKLKNQYKIFDQRIIKKNDVKNDAIYEVIKVDYQQIEYLSVNKTTAQECTIIRKMKLAEVLRQYQVQQGPERMSKCSRRQIKTYCEYFLNKTLQEG